MLPLREASTVVVETSRAPNVGMDDECSSCVGRRKVAYCCEEREMFPL